MRTVTYVTEDGLGRMKRHFRNDQPTPLAIYAGDGEKLTQDVEYIGNMLPNITGIAGCHSGSDGQYWQLSTSNGCLTSDVAKMREMDRAVGAPQIDYVETKAGICKAGFTGSGQKRRWLKAHKRVDSDAGYSDPCPGDFKSQVPQEVI